MFCTSAVLKLVDKPRFVLNPSDRIYNSCTETRKVKRSYLIVKLYILNSWMQFLCVVNVTYNGNETFYICIYKGRQLDNTSFFILNSKCLPLGIKKNALSLYLFKY